MMLGQTPELVWGGEVRWLWRYWNDPSTLCGCGETFAECPFWRAVVTEAFGGWGAVDPAEAIAYEESVVRFRTLPAVWANRLPSNLAVSAKAYGDLLSKLYAAILSVSGARAVVDTTKDPVYASFLASLSTVDLKLLHLIRDSRGVAYSHRKVALRADRIGDDVPMARASALKVAAVYNTYNALFETFRLKRIRTLQIRYEELIDNPSAKLAAFAAFAGVAGDTSGWLDGQTVELGPNHAVPGNPIQYRRGPVELAVDNEWETSLGKRERAIMSVLTLPYLVRRRVS